MQLLYAGFSPVSSCCFTREAGAVPQNALRRLEHAAVDPSTSYGPAAAGPYSAQDELGASFRRVRPPPHAHASSVTVWRGVRSYAGVCAQHPALP